MLRISIALRTCILSTWFLAVALPMLWVLLTSLKSTREIYANPFGLPSVLLHPSAETLQAARDNFVNAWSGSHFSQFFLNSVKVVSISLVGVLALGSMAAYVLARFTFFGRGFISTLFLAGLLIPMQLILIPLFFQFTDWSEAATRSVAPLAQTVGLGRLTINLHDTHFGLILIYIAASLPFTVFVLTSFLKTLPNDLREAAFLDGASEVRTFWSVMMPLAKPGLVTVAIFNFLGLWNEYLFGLVFIQDSNLKTLPLGLQSISMQAQYKSDYGLLFAGLVIAMIPTIIVYGLLQEKLTRGITVGALKG